MSQAGTEELLFQPGVSGQVRHLAEWSVECEGV